MASRSSDSQTRHPPHTERGGGSHLVEQESLFSKHEAGLSRGLPSYAEVGAVEFDLHGATREPRAPFSAGFGLGRIKLTVRDLDGNELGFVRED